MTEPKTIRAILVDDEKLARQELKYLLSEIPDISVIADCANAQDAIGRIEALRPDLIFLDIEMPELNGFDLLRELDYMPQVIFVTAYDNYAIKAFEQDALDYILKPVSMSRLHKAIEKVRQKMLADLYAGQNLLRQIFVKDGAHYYFINLKDIYLLEAAGNYTILYWQNKKCMMHKTLRQFELSLPADYFVRINRQQIVNTLSIRKVTPHYNGGMSLELEQDKTVEVSQRNGVLLKSRMKL